ncbi:MAG TPA: arsenic resistance N-acetyltransferase ArsN2 [Woeseiaceae bacterium]|nr:arsenic resistance N-acetyltransferase ArsN2 [Woeseiaceae bacterium]
MKGGTIRAATERDWPAVERLLTEANLPLDDLDAGKLQGFLVAFDPAAPPPGVTGVIGLQTFGHTGLLRSLVVDTGRRGSGIGAELVMALEEQASATGVTDLWLLTIDAEVFFWKLDYRIIERGRAPAAIRDTPEFRSFCPGSAYLMHKSL